MGKCRDIGESAVPWGKVPSHRVMWCRRGKCQRGKRYNGKT